jgi:hypothetical protein
VICRGARLAPFLLVCCLEAHGAAWTELSEACLEELGRAEESVGSLDSVCPELSEALRADPWSELLTRPPEALSARSVIELSAMAEHYQRPARGPRVDAGKLDATLAGLPAPAVEEPRSVWERITEWLRGLLGDGGEGLPGWLEQFTLPDRAVMWIWYTSVAIIVILAVAIVANEIRHHTRRRVAAGAAKVSQTGGDPAETTLEALAGRSPREQLEAMFRVIISRLQAAGALPRRPSLTHREIAATPKLSERQRGAVSAISSAAERVVYGSWSPAPEDVVGYLESGRQLLDDLADGPA